MPPVGFWSATRDDPEAEVGTRQAACGGQGGDVRGKMWTNKESSLSYFRCTWGYCYIVGY